MDYGYVETTKPRANASTTVHAKLNGYCVHNFIGTPWILGGYYCKKGKNVNISKNIAKIYK